ncbi:polysaccharide deacetylase family protein [Flavobacteriaceae bacterium F08102]|nr:polysaccharide deacetylase family protein [Flavobacteriaceae bacterium F08102]
MLLIYTQHITPRLTFTLKQFFTRILGLEIQLTTKVEEFIAHNDIKLTYAKQSLGSEIFVRSCGLLSEQGINDVEINMDTWDGVPSFFNTRQTASLPFDVFAASFYLLSRYEEYLPHVKDEYDRFPAEESLAFKHGFLHLPLVDIWAYKFKDLLKEKYPELQFPTRKFEFISTVDVDMAYSYKHKGLLRGMGGMLRDITKLKFYGVWERIMVHFGFKKDPFDTFEDLLYFQKEYGVKTLFFFLVGDYSTYDKNISSKNAHYKSLIKSIADYAEVGIHPSYFTPTDESLMKKELMRLEAIVNRPIEKSRQHYLRISLPETYQNLVNLEVREDYTMGYAAHYGFRASTCTPFYFYDLDYEIQTPLKLFPFAVMDGTLCDYHQLSHKNAFEVISKLGKEVQKVDGTFITLFHNETLSNRGRWRRWRKLYIDIFKMFSEKK